MFNGNLNVVVAGYHMFSGNVNVAGIPVVQLATEFSVK